MEFHYTDLDDCPDATGLVVVVDVLRAFSNAAYVFARGADRIHPVRRIREALELKAAIPGALACGEEGGLPPEGFDFGNSPTQTRELDLRGRVIVQRTGAGTQGIVRSARAETLLAASFVVAGATVRHIQRCAPPQVTFVVTGRGENGRGDEDLACAQYLEALLKGERPDPAPWLDRVRNSFDAGFHRDPSQPEFPLSDLDYCTALDAFDFAMPAVREDSLFTIRPLPA
jgi:2-phosphosulfolactate phosphatase